MKGVYMPMSVADPETRVLEYVNDIFQRFEGVVYGTFKHSNRKKTIKLILINYHPDSLKQAMSEHLDYEEVL